MTTLQPVNDYDGRAIKANRLAWITALEDGSYRQGQGTLRTSAYEQDLFCCLGVLVDLTDDGWQNHEHHSASPKKYVLDLVGLYDDGGETMVLGCELTIPFIQLMNDQLGMDFDAIAAALRSYWQLPPR